MPTEHTLAENLLRLQSATENIADAITEKGGTASYSDGLEAMGNKIRAIPTPQSTLVTKSITANGTYNASDDGADGYSEVTVAVPNTYSSSDNGKVVQNGSLVSQTSRTVISNGTYDTTTNNSTVVNVPETYAMLFVTTETGVTITVSKDGTILPTQTCVSGEELVFNIPESGTWTVSGSNSVSDTISINSRGSFYIGIIAPHIYGVSWDKSSSPSLTRTDEAVNFSNPNPYYSGMSGTPSSPFDNLMPWSGMVKETIDGNVFVKIPKFWYKLENTSSLLSIQISNKAQTGFKVSPAHRAFNNYDTEKDYVYVGRYKCNSSYGSKTGQTPITSITRADARSGCAAISSGKSYQMDFATFWTIRMLYLVEFANWNSQDCIGYGCSPSGSKVSTGYTDSMTYHTGTNKTSRATYGGTQYRWIEGLWDNVFEWIDGIRFNTSDVIVYNDPANYSDDSSTGAVSIGFRGSGTEHFIKDFIIPSDSNFDWALYPSTSGAGTDDDTYICDTYVYNNSGVVLNAGGSYGKTLNSGLFKFDGSYRKIDSYTRTGARLILYP